MISHTKKPYIAFPTEKNPRRDPSVMSISKASLVGEVYNLNNVADIAGTYSALSGSAVLAAGGTVAELQNSKGVQLRVSGNAMGLEISIDLAGLNISLK